MINSFEDFKESGRKLSEVFRKTLITVRPGKKLVEIEEQASRLIDESGAVASFKHVLGYRWATCINLNQGVVHGIPDRKRIKPGDLVSLDIGLEYRRWHSDMAYTFQIQSSKLKTQSSKTKDFLKVGEEALKKAIKQVKPGNRVGHISKAIQETIEAGGYTPVRELTGHGIGRKLHQAPWIPCFLDSPVGRTPLLEKGMGLAIEVIYTEGGFELEKAADGWTINTADGKMSALFEKTILVVKSGAKIITPYNWGELID